jgi:hypothetical protein
MSGIGKRNIKGKMRGFDKCFIEKTAKKPQRLKIN